jgi:hypothetical protein
VSFSVGAIFEIIDEGSPTLERLAGLFGTLQTEIDRTKGALAGLGKGEGIFSGLMSGIAAVKEGLGSIVGAATEAGAAIKTAMSEGGTAAAAAAGEIRGVAAAFTDAQRAGERYAAAGGRGADAPLLGGSMAGGAVGAFAGERMAGGGGDAYGAWQQWERDRQLRIAGPGGGGGGGMGPIPYGHEGPDDPFDRPSRQHSMLRSMLPILGAFAGYEAMKSAMEEDFSQRQTVSTLGFDPDSKEGQQTDARLRSMLTETTRGTIFTEAEAAKALREVRPVLGLTGEEGIARATGIFPGALRLGELSKMRGKGSLGDEAVAGAEFAHLEQRFDPTEVEHSLDIVNRIAKATDSSIQRQMSIAKYALPIGLAAGVDPDKTIAELGVAEQSFGATSTAGTGYAQFVLGALKTKGGTPAHLAASARTGEKEFEHLLKLEGENVGEVHKQIRGNAHDTALSSLGITDVRGRLQDVTDSGGLDVDRIKQQIFDYAKVHDRQDTLNTLTNAFGVRGERYAERYAEPGYIERERQQIGTLTSRQTVKQEQATLAMAPLQQFEQMLANVSNIGNTLATATLPGVNSALQTLNAGLIGVNEWLKGHPTATAAAGYGLEIGGGALALGLGGRMLRWMFGLGEKGVAVAEGATGVAGAAGGVAMRGGAAVGLGVGAGLAIMHGLDWLKDQAEDWLHGPGTAERGRKQLREGAPDFQGLLFPGAKAAPSNTDALSTRLPERQTFSDSHGGTPPSVGPVTIGPISITITGVPTESGYQTIIHRITDGIKSALERATGTGAGTSLSPYTSGAGMQ